MQRQDIKTMIDRLDQLELKDEFDQSCITAVISMLEDLGNLVHELQTTNTALQTELEAAIDNSLVNKAYYKSVVEDGTVIIKALKAENAKLKQDILQLEAMIDD